MSLLGLFYKDGGGSDNQTPPQQPAAAVTPVAAPIASATAATINVDPETLQRARNEVFEIAGSPYARFAVELRKLEVAIPDQTMRIRAALATTGLSVVDLVTALQTTHSAALESFKTQIAQAKSQKEQDEIARRQRQLEDFERTRKSIEEQIAQLQAKLNDNAADKARVQNEIQEQQTQIESRARTFEAATQTVSAELASVISTLQSLG